MAFKGVIFNVVKALKEGNYVHESRTDVDDKNALMAGDISPQELIGIISVCNGTHHESSDHHYLEGVEVHILRRHGWYIKFYFVDPDTVFISVHK